MKMMSKITVVDYLHSSKEEMLDLGEQHGLKGAALDNFMYALYEVKLELEVDMQTGDSKIIKCDDRIVQ